MKKLEELLKKGKKMSPAAAKAKSKVLEELGDDMMDMGADKIKHLKKVTVASDSPKGIEKGLDMAKNLIAKKDKMAEDMGEEEMPEHEAMESEGEEYAEHETGMEEKEPDEMSADELKQKIAELEELLKEKKMEA